MRVAVLGCGHVSDLYFVGCRREPLELVACADLDLNRAEQKAAEHRVPRACSPEELLPDVDLVVNLTPPLAHADVSLAALRAGKHVWSEKPLAATLEQAREVVATADETGLRLGCAPDTFLGGGLQTSMKLIDDGWIGEPVAGALCASEIGYEHFHPDVAAFYGPGGGPALDLGPYYVTAVVAMLGPIAHVTGFSRTTSSERTILTGPRRAPRAGPAGDRRGAHAVPADPRRGRGGDARGPARAAGNGGCDPRPGRARDLHLPPAAGADAPGPGPGPDAD